jgi:hypothetical protein
MIIEIPPVLLIQKTGIILSKMSSVHEISLIELYFQSGMHDFEFISAINFLLNENRIKVQFSAKGMMILNL